MFIGRYTLTLHFTKFTVIWGRCICKLVSSKIWSNYVSFLSQVNTFYMCYTVQGSPQLPTKLQLWNHCQIDIVHSQSLAILLGWTQFGMLCLFIANGKISRWACTKPLLHRRWCLVFQHSRSLVNIRRYIRGLRKMLSQRCNAAFISVAFHIRGDDTWYLCANPQALSIGFRGWLKIKVV